MNGILEQMGAYAPLVINTAKAIVFLVVGYIVAGMVSRVIRRQIERSKAIDKTLGVFFASIVKYAILAVVIIAVLQVFGFQATSLVAVLGAASLAIGLALQGTLSDIAAGVMLIIFRPYKVGQYVDIGGTSGTVQDLNIFTTELVTPDNVKIIMPNGKAWGAIITNYSANDTRRVDLTFGIDYGDDADQAMQIIREIANRDERVHTDPEPWVRVVNLGDSSVDIGVRVWCAATDYWELKFAMTKAVKSAFDDQGVSIPFPHQVHIVKQS
ncbi:MAG: mechanosensitive ion channel family protein [Proteobacteria bacterium]|nr:MAG: mechanosensitive ion channel family protein [Pseudomonadota bacterium]